MKWITFIPGPNSSICDLIWNINNNVVYLILETDERGLVIQFSSIWTLETTLNSTLLKSVYIQGWNTIKLVTGMKNSQLQCWKKSYRYGLHLFYLSVSPILWHECQRVFLFCCTIARARQGLSASACFQSPILKPKVTWNFSSKSLGRFLSSLQMTWKPSHLAKSQVISFADFETCLVALIALFVFCIF